MPDKKMKVISFFCGCGGFDLGFQGNFDYHGVHYGELPVEVISAYDFDNSNNSCSRYIGRRISLPGFFTLRSLGWISFGKGKALSCNEGIYAYS